MNSLEIISLKKNLEDYLNRQQMPKEVIRLVLKEIYDEIAKASLEEAMKEIGEGENNGTDKE